MKRLYVNRSLKQWPFDVVDVLIENHVRERLIVILTQRLIKLFGGVRYVRNRVLSVTGKIRYGIAPTMLNYTNNGS